MSSSRVVIDMTADPASEFLGEGFKIDPKIDLSRGRTHFDLRDMRIHVPGEIHPDLHTPLCSHAWLALWRMQDHGKLIKFLEKRLVFFKGSFVRHENTGKLFSFSLFVHNGSLCRFFSPVDCVHYNQSPSVVFVN